MTDRNLVTVPGTCNKQGHATAGFANLQFSKVDGGVKIDPHVTGACAITVGWSEIPKLADWFGELRTG